MILQQLRFRTKLIIGFSTILILSATIIVFAIFSIQRIAKHTDLIYHHSFVVSNSVKDINVYINAIHRSMKDLVLTESEPQINETVNIISEYDAKVHVEFDIVFERFLGEKRIIEDAHAAFEYWLPIRNNVIELIRGGKNEEAARIKKKNETEYVELLLAKIQVMIDLTEKKANEFHENIIKAQKKFTLILLLKTLFLFTISIIISLIISKSISKPIRLFIDKVNNLYEKETDYSNFTGGICWDLLCC